MSETSLNPINLADRMANSTQFKALYAEGMGLVEETANYLDGPGRAASKGLPRLAGVLYAAESMRLTTRLMQMASWLLLQRAVNNGEMNRDQVLAEKNKVRLDSFNCDRSAQGWNDLPEEFKDLVERSLRIQNRVALLDREIYRPEEAAALKPDNENSVQAQQHLLVAAGPGRMRLRVDFEVHGVAFGTPGGLGHVFCAIGHDDLDHVVVGVDVRLHLLCPAFGRPCAAKHAAFWPNT